MRKSSLGRRSSTHIPVRVPSLGPSGGQRSDSSVKKQTGSGLKQPGFISRQSENRMRSQSEDRKSYGGMSIPGSLTRANTASNLLGRNYGAMTPITPVNRMSVHSNLPSGSARPPRSQTMSTDSNRRMSSYGGKTSRKDPRPINEKSFQIAAQEKVQSYFEMNAFEVIGQGNSIRKMNTKLFVDMLDHLLKCIDGRIIITKSNYLEEIPNLMRQLNYRSKIDRSWLMTVNTPHSWQHVIALLSWLVDMVECMNAVDPYEMMYPSHLDEPCDDDTSDIVIDKNLIEHLKRTHRSPENLEEKDIEFINQLIISAKCSDEDLEVLKGEIISAKEELDNQMQIRNVHLEAVEKFKSKHQAILADYQATQHFVDETNEFIENTERKIVSIEQDINIKKDNLARKQDELKRLQEIVDTQQVTVEEKEKILKEKNDLNKMINYHEKEIHEYEKSAFDVDIKFADIQRQLENVIVEYNKLVSEKVICEPRLKDVRVNFTLLNKTNAMSLEVVDKTLKTLKEGYKNKLRTLEAQKEEAGNLLWRLQQDKKSTEEEISKETALLEGVECDLKTQEELINKESQNLKDELSRYQLMAKEVMEEITKFDPTKLENKKLELKKLEHDWELLQRKTKTILDRELEFAKEGVQEIKEALNRRNEKIKELEENLKGL